MKKWISLDISETYKDSGTIANGAELQNADDKMTASKSSASGLEAILERTLLEAAGDIRRGGKWTVTPEVRTAEIAVDGVFRGVLTGAKSIDDFRAACRRWKDAGTR